MMRACDSSGFRTLARRLQAIPAAPNRTPRILALDVGERYVGVAVSDITRSLASPVCVLERRRKVTVRPDGTTQEAPPVTPQMARETLELINKDLKNPRSLAKSPILTGGGRFRTEPFRFEPIPFSVLNQKLNALLHEFHVAAVVVGVPSANLYPEQLQRVTALTLRLLHAPSPNAPDPTIGCLRAICEPYAIDRLLHPSSAATTAPSSAAAGGAASGPALSSSLSAASAAALVRGWSASQLLSAGGVFGWSEDYSTVRADRHLLATGQMGRIGERMNSDAPGVSFLPPGSVSAGATDPRTICCRAFAAAQPSILQPRRRPASIRKPPVSCCNRFFNASASDQRQPYRSSEQSNQQLVQINLFFFLKLSTRSHSSGSGVRVPDPEMQ